MLLSEVKKILNTSSTIDFTLENGTKVPDHFHVTEVGIVTKHFIDCGGVVRFDKTANFQLWNANDYDHRLKPKKLLEIIALSEDKLGMEDLEVEVEYQAETIGKYGLKYNENGFVLTSKQTACLAEEACGIPQKMKFNLVDLTMKTSCTPGSGCC